MILGFDNKDKDVLGLGLGFRGGTFMQSFQQNLLNKDADISWFNSAGYGISISRKGISEYHQTRGGFDLTKVSSAVIKNPVAVASGIYNVGRTVVRGLMEGSRLIYNTISRGAEIIYEGAKAGAEIAYSGLKGAGLMSYNILRSLKENPIERNYAEAESKPRVPYNKVPIEQVAVLPKRRREEEEGEIEGDKTQRRRGRRDRRRQ